MIRYNLKCTNDHQFDSWFADAASYDTLRGRNLVSCAVCGDTDVSKSLMAPQIRPARGALSQAASPAEQAIAEMRKHIETNADDVGTNFAAEARKIHDGETPERAIYGQANVQEAKELIKDGVPVVPLPFMAKDKAN
ncbi:MAG: DUF1178 family protein [Nereida ignava]|uniref:DUF1178 family protein n=1 Tax=Nereida ignava TaxID=282199 RepID=UPI0030F56BEC